MSVKNIEININNGSSYDTLYPKINLVNVVGSLNYSNLPRLLYIASFHLVNETVPMTIYHPNYGILPKYIALFPYQASTRVINGYNILYLGNFIDISTANLNQVHSGELIEIKYNETKTVINYVAIYIKNELDKITMCDDENFGSFVFNMSGMWKVLLFW